MARPCEFDRSDAVAAAMKVFLSKGYEATSIDDLTSALGISRASLYNSFGDKRGLLMAAFCCADDQGQRMREDALASSKPVRDIIRSYFEGIVKLNRDREDARGCFYLTLGAELASADPEIGSRVRNSLEAHRQTFTTLLERALQSGELAKSANIKDLAAALTGTLVSVLTLVRVHPDPVLLSAVIDQAVTTLN